MKTKKNLFITLEGIDGSGKSTMIRHMHELLTQANVPHALTREPGGTKIGEYIRKLLLCNHKEFMCSQAELLIIFASRAQHLSNLILPAMKEGKWVISDRFTDSSYAYQGGGLGIPLSRIEILEQLVQEDLRPDHVIILDLPVEIALSRIQNLGNFDRIEQENKSFFERARKIYLERAKAQPARYHVLEANKSINEVKKSIATLIKKWLYE